MATRINPAQQDSTRADLRAQLEAEEERPLLGIMPTPGPKDIIALAKVTGLGVNAVKALIKIAAEGGPKAAGAAVMREATELFSIGRAKMSPAAIKQAIHTAYNDVVSQARTLAARAKTGGDFGRAESLSELGSAPRASAKAQPGERAAVKEIKAQARAGLPSMSPSEINAQNKAVEELARKRLSEIKSVEPKSPMVEARKASPRAIEAREARAQAKLEAVRPGLKEIEAAGKQGDKLPKGNQDMLGRRPGQYVEDKTIPLNEKRPPAKIEGPRGSRGHSTHSTRTDLPVAKEPTGKALPEPEFLDRRVAEIERETQELRNIGKLPGFQKGYLRRSLSETKDALLKGDAKIGPHEKVAQLPPEDQTTIARLIHDKKIRLVPRPPTK